MLIKHSYNMAMNLIGFKDKYTRIEREAKFQLADIPDDVTLFPYTRIIDLYMKDTSFRLRKIENQNGDCIALKFTQKLKRPFLSEY